MSRRILVRVSILSVLAVFCIAPAVRSADEKVAPPAQRFFEMRKYTANPGKLDALHARFRDHTNPLFIKHGIHIIGFWVPTDEKLSQNTLIYILAYPSKEARETSWKEFENDPDWK